MKADSIWNTLGVFDLIEMWEDLGVEFPINNGIHEFEEDENDY
jgi:hypothetical protein